jgi:hypothetical protein
MTDMDAYWHACSGTPIESVPPPTPPIVRVYETRGFAPGWIVVFQDDRQIYLTTRQVAMAGGRRGVDDETIRREAQRQYLSDLSGDQA